MVLQDVCKTEPDENFIHMKINPFKIVPSVYQLFQEQPKNKETAEIQNKKEQSTNKKQRAQ